MFKAIAYRSQFTRTFYETNLEALQSQKLTDRVGYSLERGVKSAYQCIWVAASREVRDGRQNNIEQG